MKILIEDIEFSINTLKMERENDYYGEYRQFLSDKLMLIGKLESCLRLKLIDYNTMNSYIRQMEKVFFKPTDIK